MNGQSIASTLLANEDFLKSYSNYEFWKGSIPRMQMLSLFSWDHLNHTLATTRMTNDRLRLSVKDGHERPNKQAFRPVRDSWELLVEDHLFAGVVKRFSRPIRTQKLRSVRVEHEHAKAVYEGMTRASYFTHEGGDEAPPALPELHEFLADIEALERVLKDVEKNNEKVRLEREKLGMPTQ